MADSEQLPAKFDIRLVAGDGYDYSVLVSDQDGNAIDFTQWAELRFQVRRTVVSDDVLYEDEQITATQAGRLQASISGSVTAEWPPQAVYEIDGEDQNGNARTVVEGEIEVKRQVAR